MKATTTILTASFVLFLCLFSTPTFAGNVSIQKAATVGTLLNLVFEETPKNISISSRNLAVQPNGVCEIWKISITSKKPVDQFEIFFDGEMAQGGLGRDNFAQEWMVEGYKDKRVCFGPSKILNEVLLFASTGGKVNFSTSNVQINVRDQGPSQIFSITGQKTPSVAFELRTSPPTNAIAGWGGDFFRATAFEWWEPFDGGWMIVKAWEGWPPDFDFMGAPPKDRLLSINVGEHLFSPAKTSTSWGKIKAAGQ